ncbi:MAG: FeoB-associated Cys-rich membrane protein [Candidatus Methanoplasma sp.]|jgi:hypothetical protein|nr:FeoB-associated Cys-rich membrane protein [Candidatus Methanoplasma sp.]
MVNEATLIAALAVAAVVILAAYYSHRSLKRGECAGCSGCGKGRPVRGKCPKEKG